MLFKVDEEEEKRYKVVAIAFEIDRKDTESQVQRQHTTVAYLEEILKRPVFNPKTA